jgi:type II secretion system protein H
MAKRELMMTLATGQRSNRQWRRAQCGGDASSQQGGRGASATSTSPAAGRRSHCRAFTLIELILVLALLAIITSLMVPRMSGFIRGRALDAEARRLFALMHAGQSRAVSEGLPMVLWVDEKQGTYGLEAETTGQNGDAKAENLNVDGNLQITALNLGLTAQTTIRNLPAIRFMPDGMIDENSPKTVRLADAGAARWLIESRNRMGYEIRDTDK